MHGGALRFRRFVAVLLLVLLSACQTWRPAADGARAIISAERPSSLRFTLTDGRLVTLRDPLVRGDSIVTVEERPMGAVGTSGVAMVDIRSVEVRRFHAGRTVVLAAAIVAAALGWAAAVTGSSGGTDLDPGPLPKNPGLGG